MVSSPEHRKLSEYARSLAPKARQILYKCPVVFFGAVLYLMYVMTVGEKMFSTAGAFPGAEAHITSAVLFVIASCISQILFFALSSYASGVISSPISESFAHVQVMHESLAAQVPPNKVFTNLFVCLAVSALITSAGFFLMYVFRAERVIRRIPSGMSMALFVSIGFLCVSYANERVLAAEMPKIQRIVAVSGFNIIGMAVTVFFYACKKRAPIVTRYSVLWVGIAFTAVFYISAYLCGETLSSLLGKGWLLSDPRKPVKLSVPNLVFSYIDIKTVLNQLPAILKIAAMNLLQFPINFPPAKAQTGRTACARNELFANGVCNAATSLFGCSTQVLPSSTIAVYESGSRSTIDTLLFAVALVFSLGLGYQCLLYIPFAVFDMLFLCLGMNIVLQSGIDAYNEGWGVLAIVAGVSLVSVVSNSVLCGAAVGATFYGVKYMLHRIAKPSPLILSDV
ncbi:hypothetical protein NEIRO03_2408 [Nematocida sp. AWRm78]|nr:hypothetical protein NEIRO02_2400 [Nematocida sp. AWRm79]KAI5186868.1 hypothetical protein NEIRO03_2408 [Nematocida sp. AWRm78]